MVKTDGVHRRSRKAEVENARTALLIDEDVARLQVAVDDSATMRVGDRLGNTADQIGDFARSEVDALHILIEAFAGDKLHRKPRLFFGGDAALVECDD